MTEKEFFEQLTTPMNIADFLVKAFPSKLDHMLLEDSGFLSAMSQVEVVYEPYTRTHTPPEELKTDQESFYKFVLLRVPFYITYVLEKFSNDNIRVPEQAFEKVQEFVQEYYVTPLAQKFECELTGYWGDSKLVIDRTSCTPEKEQQIQTIIGSNPYVRIIYNTQPV